MAKLHEVKFRIDSAPPYSLDLTPSNYYFFVDLKKNAPGKEIWEGEVIAEKWTKSQNKSFYKEGLGMLKKRWTDYNLLLTYKVEFCKNVF
jgi:hypothetical protein